VQKMGQSCGSRSDLNGPTSEALWWWREAATFLALDGLRLFVKFLL